MPIPSNPPDDARPKNERLTHSQNFSGRRQAEPKWPEAANSGHKTKSSKWQAEQPYCLIRGTAVPASWLKMKHSAGGDVGDKIGV